MSVLGDIRQELATVLSSLDLNTYPYLPPKAALPSAVILAGSPYVESGQTMGSRTVRLEVWISVQKGSNQSETDQGDLLVEAAVDLLEEDGWLVEYVGQPTDWDVNNGSALTIPLIVTSDVTLSN